MNTLNIIKAIPIAFIAALILPNIAIAGGGPPEPSTSTQADYYVSWDTGSDSNPGTLSLPFKTPGKALKTVAGLSNPAGKVVLIREGIYRLKDSPDNRLKIKYLNGAPGAPIQFRGYPGETVIFDSFLEEFNPLALPIKMECGWGGIEFMDSNHILVENIKVRGCQMWNIGVTDSNYITLRFVESSRATKHAMFTGGSFHHLLIEGCKFYEIMYGPQASHGLYISGGHWDPEKPPVQNVIIRYCECFFNHRHGIQFNGRIEDVVVEHCNLHHNVLGGVSVIGARNVNIESNLMYKNNKQGVILYTYIDTSYWDPKDPESMAHWKKTHWTIENVNIQNNTIFMDDVAWYDDEWINYKPWYHATIYMIDSTDLLPPFKNILIKNNILYNHSKMMVNMKNTEFFPGVKMMDNFILSEDYDEMIACGNSYTLSELEKDYPNQYSGNLCGFDPEHINLTPTKPIDGTNIGIDFSDPKYNNFVDDFHLETQSKALAMSAGAYIMPMSNAQTVILTEKSKTLPPGVGYEIAEKVFQNHVKPEVQNWICSIFNAKQLFLDFQQSPDQKERLCFRLPGPGIGIIAFAILNDEKDSVQVTTRMESYGDLELLHGFGVAFDSQMDFKIDPNMMIIDDTMKCTLTQQGLGILLALYKEK